MIDLHTFGVGPQLLSKNRILDLRFHEMVCRKSQVGIQLGTLRRCLLPPNHHFEVQPQTYEEREEGYIAHSPAEQPVDEPSQSILPGGWLIAYFECL